MSTNDPGSMAQACEGCACGEDITRRTMLTQAALAAIAATLAACGANVGDFATSPTTVTKASLKVSTLAGLASAGGVAFTTVSGVPLAIVRTSDTTFLALSRICPHQGSIVGQFSGGFQCPRHGATFDKSGQWIGGQPANNMTAYTTTYDPATDTLTIG